MLIYQRVPCFYAKIIRITGFFATSKPPSILLDETTFPLFNWTVGGCAVEHVNPRFTVRPQLNEQII